MLAVLPEMTAILRRVDYISEGSLSTLRSAQSSQSWLHREAPLAQSRLHESELSTQSWQHTLIKY